MAAGLWIHRIALTNFRNYAFAELAVGPEPVVLVGANGAGKTNLLEAASLLVPGNGLRRAEYAELPRTPGPAAWAVAAEIETPRGPAQIGTGQQPDPTDSGRLVRINGRSAG